MGLSREFLVTLPIVAGLGLGFFLVVRQRPRVGVAVWLITVAAVPIWFGVDVIFTFYPASAVGLVVLAALARGLPLRLGVADLFAFFFFAACLAPVLSGGATLSTVFALGAIWLVAYALGRYAPSLMSLPWIYAWVGVVFTGVAALAIVEFLLDWHPFAAWGPANDLFATWGPIQGRSGLARSEGAFGHSIALGASIALAIPMMLSSAIRPTLRLASTALMLAGVAVTLSRISLVAAGLGVLLTVVFVREGAVDKIRLPAAGVLLGGAIALIPFASSVLSSADDEFSLSADYRLQLVDLLPDIDLLGFSTSASIAPTGELQFAGFQSIDSQVLLVGLKYGAIPLVCGLVLLGLAMAAMVVGRATGPTVAVVAHIPALMTVALITQYAMVFWFVVGLSVASQTRPNAAPAGAETTRINGAIRFENRVVKGPARARMEPQQTPQPGLSRVHEGGEPGRIDASTFTATGD